MYGSGAKTEELYGSATKLWVVFINRQRRDVGVLLKAN